MDWIESNGWAGEVFLDLDPERGLVAGLKWEAALKQAVHRCEAILPLISKEWLASKWCLSEVGTARLLGKPIIPFLIDNTDISALPADMVSEQIVDRKGDPQWEIRLEEGLKRANLDPKSFYFEEGRRPYPGLMPLTEDDAAIFFGRDAQIVRGLDRLRTLKSGGIERLMVILGASGVGKSSFLRAGLWPRLDRDDRNFLPIAVLRPELAVLSGKLGLYQALAETASCNPNRKSNLISKNLPTNKGDINRHVLDQGLLGYLSGLRDASRVPLSNGKASNPPTVVLSVDQAEELFGPDGSNESDLFLDILTKTLLVDQQLIVILAIRSDAYPQVQADPRLAKISQNEANLFNLVPMKQGSYRTVIEGPAKLVMPKPLDIEPLLTEALLEDSSGEDALPLLAFTLERLYENFGNDGDLTLDEYNKMGRLKGAIEAAVNDSFAKALKNNIAKDKSEFENAIKAAFIPHLADVNDADQFVRRIAPTEKLPSHTHNVVSLLADQHLLIKDRRGSDNREQDIIEVAHEALLREWPLLWGWLEEEKDNIRAIGAASRSAAEWEKNGCSDDWLVHTGERLSEAMKLSMRDDMKKRVGELEKKYLNAAIEKEETNRREREEQQKREHALKDQSERRKTWVMRISIIACVVAVTLGTVAVIAYLNADKERINAQNLLAKNYWSDALDAKENNKWLRLLHYRARTGEITTNRSYAKNAVFDIKNYGMSQLGVK